MDFDELAQALVDAGSPWEATAEPIFETQDAGVAALGLAMNEDDEDELLGLARGMERTMSAFALTDEPPPFIDWRLENVVSEPKDQGACLSCVAFATCAAMESRLRLLGYDVDLAEAHLFHCGQAGGCATGWQISPALRFAKDVGVGLAADLPYDGHQPTCTSVGSAAKVLTWRAVDRANVRRRMIAENGPVVGGMYVYSDLLHYKTGVYRHVAGRFEGRHAVCIVGYSDADQCWIVKNSWGTGFGEDGYLRIGYGECQLDTRFPFFDIDVDIA